MSNQTVAGFRLSNQQVSENTPYGRNVSLSSTDPLTRQSCRRQFGLSLAVTRSFALYFTGKPE